MQKVFSTLLVWMLISFSLIVMAQKKAKPNYQTAIGFKFYPISVSLKTRLNKGNGKSALEFIGYFKDGFRLTGLYEFAGRLNEEGNLKWYIGAGGHLGLGNKANGGNIKLGVDGVLGLDYKFLNLPLNISLDWQPAYGFGDDERFTKWGGVGVRITL